MKVTIGADHAGYHLKEALKKFLKGEGHQVIDVGAHKYTPGDDYPPYAIAAAEKVANGEADRGVLVCDSGIGVDIVANKIPGVRSALVHDEDLARLTRQHNNSNVLSLGAMFMDEVKAEKITKNWLDTDFSHEERHERRVREIAELERTETYHAEI
ncbi:MAG: ribose-5-phosphate isomerase [Armatimonadetes bacterium]|nr:ribose-5-phosphate isomerase [Armatimonadota bacterium]